MIVFKGIYWNFVSEKIWDIRNTINFASDSWQLSYCSQYQEIRILSTDLVSEPWFKQQQTHYDCCCVVLSLYTIYCYAQLFFFVLLSLVQCFLWQFPGSVYSPEFRFSSELLLIVLLWWWWKIEKTWNKTPIFCTVQHYVSVYPMSK